MGADPRAVDAARRFGPPIVLVGLLLLAWEILVRLSGVSPFVLPSPTEIVGALWDNRADAARHAIPTLVEALVGLAVAVIGATLGAVALDRAEWARRAVEPLLVATQTIPIIAIAPLLVVWLGFGIEPKILVVVLVTFFPVTIALLRGFASTTPEAMELMRSLGASADQTFRKVRWPSGLPAFFTGLRISATYAVVGAIIGEYVGATEGLGIWMRLSQRLFRTDLVFAGILVTAVLSVVLYAGVVLIERAAIPWWAASREARLPERAPVAR